MPDYNDTQIQVDRVEVKSDDREEPFMDPLVGMVAMVLKGEKSGERLAACSYVLWSLI